MKFALIEEGKVSQVQPYPGEGFIEAPANVVCGMIFDGENYSNPEQPEPTTNELILQLELSVTSRRMREANLTVEGKAWLQDIDNQIAALRS